MQTQPAHKMKQEGIFSSLLSLTAFFLLLEISFFIQCNQAYFSDFSLVSIKLQIPYSIAPGIIFYLFSQLLLHFCYCVFVTTITTTIADYFQLPFQRKLKLGVMLWMLGIATVLVANLVYIPNSKFSELISIFLPNKLVAGSAFIFLSICCLSFTMLALGLMISSHVKKAFVVVIILAGLAIIQQPKHATAFNSSQPNIIIVGMDSLRPDYLSYFGGEQPTRFFDAFLNQATVFTDAITPIARTFPSWTGILTGEYPNQSGIRSNLVDQTHSDFSESLPSILKRHGYETIYATDETRFSNIDKNYGFDDIITPPTGLNDFLLGSLNDFPFSNLLVNTSLGKWLFPYSYANRPAFITYEPASFFQLIQPALIKKRSKPLFLSIHFCLTHFPYLWASLPGNDYNVRQRYVASVVRADKQVSDFFALLQENHLLEHAIVVLLSDHGEALELPGDRVTEIESFQGRKGRNNKIPEFYPASLEKEALNESAGHGTDVLGLTQYHTLLAFKLYGMAAQQVGDVKGLVTLLDIKPTVLNLLGIHHPNASYSLATYIQGQKHHPQKPKDIFLESDYSPEAIRTVYPETRKVLLEGMRLYQIDPSTTRLTVKNSMYDMIIKSKQYADIRGDWMLALYPQAQHVQIPILINLFSGEWTDDLHSSFALESPAKDMLKALHSFYGNEIYTN